MNSHVHIGLYDALREAGASEEKARIAAADIPVGQNLVTKEDLLQAIAGINDRIAALDRGMAVLKYGYGPIIIGLLVKLVFLPLTLIRSGGASRFAPFPSYLP